MKKLFLLTIIVLFSACGGRKMTNHYARSLISANPQAALQESDIEVSSLSQTSGSEAIVETKIQTVFRLERKGRDWTVQEARIGHGQWEKIETLAQALVRVKIEETQLMLEKIAEAILRYKKNTGKAPVFKDYISLSDILTPNYLTPLIRLDAWRRPLDAQHSGANAILLVSAGPDGMMGTKDDIKRVVEQ
jgi:hypothetical protein